MRRPFSVQPPTASPSESLHPILQATLTSLDIQLETELTRYRRQRQRQVGRGRGKSTTASRNIVLPEENRQQQYRSLDMIAVGAVGGRTQPLWESQEPVVVAAPPVEPNAAFEQDFWQEENLGSGTVAPEQPLAIATHRATRSNPESFQQMELSSAGFDESREEAVGASDRPVDDYFASSEELLRSLAEEEVDLRRHRETGLLESLLTPLGVGSLLLLLLSSVTLGYFILDPSPLKLPAIQSLFNRQSSVPATAPVETTVVSPLPGPDLATEEFKDLSLDTLSTLPDQSSSAPPVALPSSTDDSSVDPTPAVATPDGIPGVAQQRSPSAAVRSPQPPTVRAAAPAGDSAVVSVPRTPPRSAARTSSQTSRRTISNGEGQPAPPRAARSTAPQQTAPQTARSTASTPPRPASVSRPDPQPARTNPAPSIAAASSPIAPVTAPGRLYYVTTPYSGDRSLEAASSGRSLCPQPPRWRTGAARRFQ
jgi:hypothetical protein